MKVGKNIKMKRVSGIALMLCAVVMMMSLVACGKAKDSGKNDTGSNNGVTVEEGKTEGGTDSATPQTGEDAGLDLKSIDYSNPTIVVELDDAATMSTLMQDMANMRIEEGTIVKVTGKTSTTLSTSLMAKKDDGSSIGVMLTVQGEWETPVNGTVLEAVGVIVKGKYSMEYHVLPENIVTVGE